MYPNYEYDKTLVGCIPTSRQLNIESMEFYAFIHYTVNAFTDNEWGDGTEDPRIFNPSALDANQWVSAVKAAGMKGLILTCKHHDGFCLWPSAYTEHSVKNSPFRGGKGDVVREVSDACKRAGIQFGIYLSPWDRNNSTYGQGKAYDDYFCAQLRELLTGYGEVFSVWFDGACGEGKNGKRQEFDWERYYGLIRSIQPNACITVMGPDVRWCGNEAGDTRESEWSVLPTEFFSQEEIAAKSQQTDDVTFREKTINQMDRDLGSRDFLQGAKGLRWWPAETDVSIRPGWFYHASEDDQVRTPQNLIDIWYRSVGGNSTLLLNIPPDRFGLLHENDVKSLREMGEYIQNVFADNLAKDAHFTADSDDGIHTADALRNDSYDSYYKTNDGVNTAVLHICLNKVYDISHVVIKEHIPMSQRIEKYRTDAKLSDGTWKEIAKGTTIGYKKIDRFETVSTDEIRICIEDSRVCPVLSFIGIY